MISKNLLKLADSLEPYVQTVLPTDIKFGLFLEYLMESGDVAQAAREAELHPRQIRLFRRNNPEAQKAFEEALDIGTDAIEAELHRRAVVGYLEPVFYKGRRVNTVRKKSDILLMFLLKKRRPEYRDSYEAPTDPTDALHDIGETSPAEKIARRLDQLADRKRTPSNIVDPQPTGTRSPRK